jgi:hypothetical protein
MSALSTNLLILAAPCAIAGVVLMMAMVGALQKRGHTINWLWIRLYVLKYIGQYKSVTTQETGRPGPFFYPFVVLMNSALVMVVLAFVFA